MIAWFRDHMRNIVDRDDAIEQHHYHEKQQKERETVQKRKLAGRCEGM
jgi:hypothetical protein